MEQRLETNKSNEVLSKGESSSPWSTLKNVLFRGRQKTGEQTQRNNINTESQTRDSILQNVRHDNKFAKAIVYGANQLGRPDVELNQSEKQTALKKIESGEFTEKSAAAILSQLATPLDLTNENVVIESLKVNPLAVDILKTANRAIDSARDLDRTIRGEDVYHGPIDKFLKSFPTPIEFDSLERGMMDSIRNNSPRDQEKYAAAMQYFKKKVYGKREEYYQSFKRLRYEAANLTAEKNFSSQKIDTNEKLIPPELRQLFNNARIDGDSFVARGGRVLNLDKSFLLEKGLVPHKSIKLDGCTIGFSKSFTSHNHSLALGYVRTAEKVKVVSYYFSRSQATWRLLPDYVSDQKAHGQGIGLFGKGYTEESTILPEKLQAELNNNLRLGNLTLTEEEAEFAIAGTAKRYSTPEEYARNLKQGTMRGDFYREVNPTPFVKLSNNKLGLQKSTPESLDITGPFAPNFKNINRPQKIDSPLYGEMNSYIVNSYNSMLRYNFSVDSKNHVFIAGTEVDSALSSDGVRTEWAQLGDLSTPLYDYERQTGGYGDQNDRLPGTSYISMWRNYLSKMPIIQKFQAIVANQSDSQ